jgi:glycosyltransferase involved in cell wall biosynthesis
MRVLLVHNFYQIPGGEDSIVREELSLLAQHGVDVELFSVSNTNIKGPLGAITAAFQVVYNPFARRALSKKLAEFQPDVVHIHNFFPLLSPSVFDACQDAGVPSVLTLHNFRILCPTALLHPADSGRHRSLRQACWWTIPKEGLPKFGGGNHGSGNDGRVSQADWYLDTQGRSIRCVDRLCQTDLYRRWASGRANCR